MLRITYSNVYREFSAVFKLVDPKFGPLTRREGVRGIIQKKKGKKNVNRRVKKEMIEVPSPGFRSRPPAEVARFLLPSSSRSDDLLVRGCAAGNIMTFVVDVARRVPQNDEPPVSAGSSIRGVELPNANTMCDLSFFFRASIRASRS